MALALYLSVAASIVFLWRRQVANISRVTAVVLLCLPMLLTGRALLTNGVYSTTDILFRDPPFRDYAADFGRSHMHNGWVVDPFVQMVPWQKAVRHALARGEWPLWNPFILCGTGLAAAMQAAPYDPINLVALLLPLDLSITFSATMTFFLASFLAFAFARELGCEERASLVAATVYMLSTAMTFTIGWSPHTRTWALAGLVFVAVRRLVREPGVRSGAMLLVALVLLVFAGHPESLFHVVACGVAYGLFEMARTPRNAARAAIAATATGLIALLLTAVSLLPFYEALPQTAEYPSRLTEVEYVPEPALTKRRAGATFLPFFGGSASRENVTRQWDTGAGRVGSIALALAIAALLTGGVTKEKWFFAALAVIGLWAHFEAPPVVQLLHALPLFDLALNDRLSFAAAFALAILAALAVNARDGRRMALAAGVVFVLLSIATALVWREQVLVGVAPSLIRTMIAAELLPLAVMATIGLTRLPTSLAVPLLLLCIGAQRLIADGDTYPTLPRHTFYPRTPLMDAMKSDGLSRMVGVGATLLPNTSALYELEDVRGYEAMTFRRLAETFALWSIPQPVFFNRVDDLARPFLSMMNVRFAIGSRTVSPPRGWRVVAEDRNSRVLENMRVLPRVFAPRLIRVRHDDIAILNEMNTATDFSEVGWISSDKIPEGELPNGRATITTRRAGSGYSIDVSMDGGGWLIISDAAWSGWQAVLDGKHVRTHFANHAFLGIFVPHGTHQLRLVYRPDSFRLGLAVSTSMLALLILAGIFTARRSAPAPSARSTRE